MSAYIPNLPTRCDPAVVIHRLNLITARMNGWTAEIRAELEAKKYNPNQPRAPRGSSIGGQWVDSGGGSGGASGGGRFGLPKPARDPRLHDAMTRKPPHERDPSDLLEGGGFAGPARGGGLRSPSRTGPLPKSPTANQAAGKIKQLNRQGADDLQDVLTSRAQGRVSAKESHQHIRDAADDVEKFLGGKIEAGDIKPSKSNDLVILKGDKKFRMDVKALGRTRDRKGIDDPRFYFQQRDTSGNWVDASDIHKNYFKKD